MRWMKTRVCAPYFGEGRNYHVSVELLKMSGKKENYTRKISFCFHHLIESLKRERETEGEDRKR